MNMQEQCEAINTLVAAIREQMAGIAFDATIYGWKDDARDGDARITFSIPLEQRDFAKNLVAWNRRNVKVIVILEPEDIPPLP